MKILQVTGSVDHDMRSRRNPIGRATFSLCLDALDYQPYPDDPVRGGLYNRELIIAAVKAQGGAPLCGEWRWETSSLAIYDNVTISEDDRGRIMAWRREVRATLEVLCW